MKGSFSSAVRNIVENGDLPSYESTVAASAGPDLCFTCPHQQSRVCYLAALNRIGPRRLNRCAGPAETIFSLFGPCSFFVSPEKITF